MFNNRCLMFEIWSFFEAWFLELDVFFLSSPREACIFRPRFSD